MTDLPEARPDTSRLGARLLFRYGKALSAADRDESAQFAVYGSAGRISATSTPLVHETCVIVGRKGNVGQVHLDETGCWPIDTTYYAEVPDGVDPRFLYWQLTSLDLRRLDSSTTTPSLRREDLEAQEIWLPPIDEQRRIVAVLEDHLSRLDAGMESLAQAGALLSSLERSAFDALEAEAVRDPATSTVSLSELGRVTSGATPARGNRAYYDGGTIPWIVSGDLVAGVVSKPRYFITQKAVDETSVKLVPSGSLLIAMYGEGKTRGTVAELALTATTNQACAALIFAPETQAMKPWVKAVLTGRYLAMRRMALGGVQPNLSVGAIKAMTVPVPDDGLRSELLERIDALTAARNRLAGSLASGRSRSVALRRSLLAAAFSGRLTGVARV